LKLKIANCVLKDSTVNEVILSFYIWSFEESLCLKRIIGNKKTFDKVIFDEGLVDIFFNHPYGFMNF
jgi:hypothetical protein